MQGCSAKLAGEPRLASSCIYFFFANGAMERAGGRGNTVGTLGTSFSLDEVKWAESAQNSALHTGAAEYIPM